MKIQFCFSVNKDGNEEIIRKMKEIKEKLEKEYGEEYEILSCHLPRKILEEKNFSTEIADAFEDIFGDKYKCQVKADTFEEAMKNINSYRIKTSQCVDRLFILSNSSVSNIALELEYFTNKKIMYI